MTEQVDENIKVSCSFVLRSEMRRISSVSVTAVFSSEMMMFWLILCDGMR